MNSTAKLDMFHRVAHMMINPFTEDNKLKELRMRDFIPCEYYSADLKRCLLQGATDSLVDPESPMLKQLGKIEDLYVKSFFLLISSDYEQNWTGLTLNVNFDSIEWLANELASPQDLELLFSSNRVEFNHQYIATLYNIIIRRLSNIVYNNYTKLNKATNFELRIYNLIKESNLSLGLGSGENSIRKDEKDQISHPHNETFLKEILAVYDKSTSTILDQNQINLILHEKDILLIYAPQKIEFEHEEYDLIYNILDDIIITIIIKKIYEFEQGMNSILLTPALNNNDLIKNIDNFTITKTRKTQECMESEKLLLRFEYLHKTDSNFNLSAMNLEDADYIVVCSDYDIFANTEIATYIKQHYKQKYLGLYKHTKNNKSAGSVFNQNLSDYAEQSGSTDIIVLSKLDFNSYSFKPLTFSESPYDSRRLYLNVCINSNANAKCKETKLDKPDDVNSNSKLKSKFKEVKPIKDPRYNNIQDYFKDLSNRNPLQSNNSNGADTGKKPIGVGESKTYPHNHINNDNIKTDRTNTSYGRKTYMDEEIDRKIDTTRSRAKTDKSTKSDAKLSEYFNENKDFQSKLANNENISHKISCRNMVFGNGLDKQDFIKELNRQEVKKHKDPNFGHILKKENEPLKIKSVVSYFESENMKREPKKTEKIFDKDEEFAKITKLLKSNVSKNMHKINNRKKDAILEEIRNEVSECFHNLKLNPEGKQTVIDKYKINSDHSRIQVEQKQMQKQKQKEVENIQSNLFNEKSIDLSQIDHVNDNKKQNGEDHADITDINASLNTVVNDDYSVLQSN